MAEKTLSEFAQEVFEKDQKLTKAARDFVWHPENWEAYESLKTSQSHSIPVEFMELCYAVEDFYGKPKFEDEKPETKSPRSDEEKEKEREKIKSMKFGGGQGIASRVIDTTAEFEYARSIIPKGWGQVMADNEAKTQEGDKLYSFAQKDFEDIQASQIGGLVKTFFLVIRKPKSQTFGEAFGKDKEDKKEKKDK